MTPPNIESLTSESLAELISWLKLTVESGTQFVSEQAPLVAWEIVVFGRAISTFIFLFAALMICVSIFLLKKGTQKIKALEEAAHSEEGALIIQTILFMVSGVFSSVFGVVTLTESHRDFFLSWFAPRLYIIEYLTNLL